MSIFDNYMCDGQLSIFDYQKDVFKIDKPIRLIELFAGVGSQAMALRDIGADFEHYRAVEFDKYAIASYNAIHDTDFPVMDVTKITGEDLGIMNTDKYCYILTYSFPCTDLSLAGKMLGMEEGSGTRSSLLWEVKRLLEETKELPQVLLMENVPQVHSESNMPHFQKWLDFLESKGYSTYWKDMNAKDYGVAQSRNRTIAVSILGDYSYQFPFSYPLDRVMKDYLEPVVDEKYYIKTDKAKELIDKLIRGGKINVEDEIGSTHFPHGWLGAEANFGNEVPTIDAGIWKHHTLLIEKEVTKIGGLLGDHQATTIYDTGGISPTLQAAMSHGNTMPYIVEVNGND